MLTINLEKQLIKQNKKVLLPTELLSIKEYERLGDDFCESEVLSRIGINRTIKEGKERKKALLKTEEKLAKFPKERLFHISQIESLCKKYHLRFLYANYFKGTIDENLAAKVSNFEIANGVECNSYNCKIAAPASSFFLEKRPKDPLFFFDAGDNYWYLIHKWGNDLSLIRRAYKFLSSAWLTYFTIAIPLLFLVATGIHNHQITNGGVICIVAFIMYTMASFIAAVEFDGIRFIKSSEWDSAYLD